MSNDQESEFRTIQLPIVVVCWEGGNECISVDEQWWSESATGNADRRHRTAHSISGYSWKRVARLIFASIRSLVIVWLFWNVSCAQRTENKRKLRKGVTLLPHDSIIVTVESNNTNIGIISHQMFRKQTTKTKLNCSFACSLIRDLTKRILSDSVH